MIRFNCDYSEGAHERILKKLVRQTWNRHLDTERTTIVGRRRPLSAISAKGKMLTYTSWWEGPRPT